MRRNDGKRHIIKSKILFNKLRELRSRYAREWVNADTESEKDFKQGIASGVDLAIYALRVTIEESRENTR